MRVDESGQRPPRRVAVVAGASALLAIWLVIGGSVGLIAGLGTGIVCARLTRRIEPSARRRARRVAAAELPFAADLLAAALRSGIPMAAAIRTTGVAIGTGLGRDLVRVADGFGLGLEPPDAWAALNATPTATLHGVRGADRIVTAAVRSADSGAALAQTLERLAEDLRSARMVNVEAAAQRVGVLIVLPLGLCFLPAFVLAGIVPVIVAVLGGVLR